jgi:hypothetical protein
MIREGNTKLRKLRLFIGGTPLPSKSRNSRNADVFRKARQPFAWFLCTSIVVFTLCVSYSNLKKLRIRSDARRSVSTKTDVWDRPFEPKWLSSLHLDIWWRHAE